MISIEVKNLTKVYKQKRKQAGIISSFKSLLKNEYIYTRAIDNVNFSIQTGEMVGLLGPNGAGKTTIIKMLTGIVYPTQGEIIVENAIPYFRENEFLKKISLVSGQKNQMLWDLPAIDTLIWLKSIYGLSSKEFNVNLDNLINIFKAEQLLELQVRRMSLGQRMKMELIAAMIHTPKVLFLDEPTIGLDILSQMDLRRFIKSYNKKYNATIIITSHNIQDVKELCDRTILINDGNVSHDMQLDNLIEKYGYYEILHIKGLSKSINFSLLKMDLKYYHQENDEAIIHIDKNNTNKLISILMEKFEFSDIKIDKPDIDSIFKDIYLENKAGM